MAMTTSAGESWDRNSAARRMRMSASGTANNSWAMDLRMIDSVRGGIWAWPLGRQRRSTSTEVVMPGLTVTL